MATLTLRTLTCFETHDEFGPDHPYIKVNGNVVWGPVEIDAGEDAEVACDVDFDGEATVELWEKDSVSRDDLIGSRTVRAGDGEGEARFTYENGSYRLSYEAA